MHVKLFWGNEVKLFESLEGKVDSGGGGKGVENQRAQKLLNNFLLCEWERVRKWEKEMGRERGRTIVMRGREAKGLTANGEGGTGCGWWQPLLIGVAGRRKLLNAMINYANF